MAASRHRPGSAAIPTGPASRARAARRSRRARCVFPPGCSGASRKAHPCRARRAASSGTCWFGRFTSSPALPRTRRRISWPRRSFRRSTPRSIRACTSSIVSLPESFKGRTQSAHRFGRGAIPGADPRDFQRNHRHVRKALEGASAARRRPVRQVSEQGLRARPPDARGKPDRERHHAGGSRARRCTAPSAHALARRIGRRSAGAGVQRTGGVRRAVRK